MSLFRTLLWIFFGYVLYKIAGRLFSSTKKEYGYTAEQPRQEGDVVIEKRAPQKSKTPVSDNSEYVDFEEME